MATCTTEQKIVVEVTGKTATGKPAALDTGTLTFEVSDPAVASIAEVSGSTARLVGVGVGDVTITVTYTAPDLILTAVSEVVSVTGATVASIEVTLGAVEPQ